ncbi:hypothetical protein [Laspinema olomoucense]|uniref:hypothetical protein n=1 Tax=Laspinema olomoucense TaxID=3231600 RepID=UPI0021BACBB6|nr:MULTISPECIES: hypothetical protein [unclassified Laspinema]MCT7973678.1 hypothetical protein [Laspinema sp. D3d]MCT7996272.1 hypothetical protein [Laspinema sp. D3c]
MARKSKDFGKLLKQERANQIQQKGMKKLQQKVKEGPLGEHFEEMVMNLKGEVKMSDVLQAFVEPYRNLTDDWSEQEKLFHLAVIAWNLSLMPENERPALIDEFMKVALEGNDPLVQQDAQEIIDELIARKQKLFDEHKRLIVDFELQYAGEQFHLSVASTLLEPIVPDLGD